MIVLKLQGGLGNQLFQFAAYNVLKSNFNNVFLDVSEYNEFSYRKYLLNYFGKGDEKLICFLPDFGFIKKILFIYRIKKQFKNIKILTNKFKNRLVVNEMAANVNFEQLVKNVVQNSYLTGFFLAPPPPPLFPFKFFGFNKSLLKSSMLCDFVSQCNSVSIHVRRTDYVNNSDYEGICSDFYYINAIEYIKKNESELKFYVFSDDINYAKQLFSKYDNFYYVENNNCFNDESVSDLYLMSLCKHNIIANSTFSVCAAYFNKNPNKIICRPPHYKNNYQSDYIFPKEWNIISNTQKET